MYVVNFYTSELLPHVFKGALLTFFTITPPPPPIYKQLKLEHL